MTNDSEFSIENMQKVIDIIRHCAKLGIRAHTIKGNQVTFELPYSKILIGNPDTGVIHGGALTTLLDTTCGMSVPLATRELELAPTLDLRIDYMSAAKPDMNIYARAEAYRVTKNVVFAKGIAYQDDEENPVAQCVATFMRLPKEVASLSRKEVFNG